jgi:hypothetical protein
MPIPIKNSSRSVSEIADVFKNRIEKFRTVAQSVANSLNRNKEEVIRKLYPAPCQAVKPAQQLHSLCYGVWLREYSLRFMTFKVAENFPALFYYESLCNSGENLHLNKICGSWNKVQ